MLDSIHHRHRNTCCNMLAGCKRRRTDNGNISTATRSKTRRISTKTERPNKTRVFMRIGRARIAIPTRHISIKIKHHINNNNRDHMAETSGIVAEDVVSPISSSSTRTSTKDKINTSTVPCWRILGLS